MAFVPNLLFHKRYFPGWPFRKNFEDRSYSFTEVVDFFLETVSHWFDDHSTTYPNIPNSNAMRGRKRQIRAYLLAHGGVLTAAASHEEAYAAQKFTEEWLPPRGVFVEAPEPEQESTMAEYMPRSRRKITVPDQREVDEVGVMFTHHEVLEILLAHLQGRRIGPERAQPPADLDKIWLVDTSGDPKRLQLCLSWHEPLEIRAKPTQDPGQLAARIEAATAPSRAASGSIEFEQQTTRDRARISARYNELKSTGMPFVESAAQARTEFIISLLVPGEGASTHEGTPGGL